MSTLAIMAFVFCLERFYIVPLSWPEAILHGAVAIALIWANDTVNYIGFGVFILLTMYQIIAKKKSPKRKPESGNLKLKT